MNSPKITDRVLKWYDANRRILPWRYAPGLNADPYRVWLSEMMLQQTQVDTVIPYFERFTAKWPTIHALAAASLDDILHLWQGLGYYARARNLYKCAQRIVIEFNGVFPSHPEELIKLPGIGPYASAAISAIAFNYPATVVDGNVARIISRVFGMKTPVKQNQKQIRVMAGLLTPKLRAGDYAQALMDIGSAVCTPRTPKCQLCPFMNDCKAYSSGDPSEFPQRTVKLATPTRYAVAFVFVKDGQILLRKRSDKKMLEGLWELPGSDWEGDSLSEFPTDIVYSYMDVKHTFSHFHLLTRVFRVSEIEEEYLNGSEVWCELDKLDALALSTLTKKLLSKSGINCLIRQNPLRPMLEGVQD
jgi:A/G-specific adenine glycosylase